MENSLILNDYSLLKEEIIRLAQEGKARARAAVAQETLRTYHGIGGGVARARAGAPGAGGLRGASELIIKTHHRFHTIRVEV